MAHLPTNEEWAASKIGTRTPMAYTNATQILTEYHSLPNNASSTELRRILLIRLGIVAKVFVACNSSSPYLGCFADLGMRVDKQLETMNNSARAWRTARKIFAPVQSPFGKTNALQHYKMHDAAPTSSDNYWLESLDPKHRSWGHEDARHGFLFNRWMADTTTTLGFFDWLEHKNLGSHIKKVQYLAPDERWKYWCVFGDDKLMYRHRAMLYPEGADGRALERFNTRRFRTHSSGDNFAIWVCSPDGYFYTFSHTVSEFHHSTFLSGGRVLAAGEWVVSDGRLLLITHKTGHYAATPLNLYRALQLLKTQIDLSKTVVQITDFRTNITQFFNAMEFISKAGKIELCASISDGTIKQQAVSLCERNAVWEHVPRTPPRLTDIGDDSRRYFTG